MSDFTLSIFPSDAAITVTTTVWVGVMVVVFLNLRLGWTLSGLVVPGYLVPLLIAKPISAAVICLEALLTYWIVFLISERANRLPGWSSFFGRDRFFVIVIVSVLIRAALDGWLLPWLGSRVNDWFGMAVDYRVDLHSYGLIVVSLMANYLWKPGLIRGWLPMVVTVAATYLIVRYGLIELTNFNVGSLQFVYDDIATSLLASPKAYVILLTTAFLASWMNLRYGWEFNGILIPALLALLWHEPWKIVASLSEGLAVLLLATLVLKLPIWQKTTVEGGRKIMVFFTICFVYRLVLGYVVPAIFPTYRVTDVYGFGYLVSTLLAVKAHDKNLTIRLAISTIQVSIYGALAGSLIGFLLTLLPQTWLAPDSSSDRQEPTMSLRLDRDLADVIRMDKLLLYQKQAPESYQRPMASELELFGRGLRLLKKFVKERQPAQLAEAQRVLLRVNYAVHIIQDRLLYLSERSPARGWGLYALRLGKPDGLLIEVPAPMDEWATLEAGTLLFRELEASALAVAGTRRQNNAAGAADVLSRPDTLFSIFHREFCRGNALQVRGYADHSLQAIAGNRDADAYKSITSSLWIKGALPQGMKLSELEKWLTGFEIRWKTTTQPNILRDDTWSGFGELLLSRSDRRNMLAQLAVHDTDDERANALKHNNGHLHRWLLQTKSQMARRGANEYVSPRLEELLYLDEEVLQPLIQIARKTSSWANLAPQDLLDLRAAAAAASVFDYQVILFHDSGSSQDSLCLAEWEPRRRHWGTFVLRCQLSQPYVIEVPRPLYEINSFEFGLSLFQRHEASALLLAGAHPQANVDGSSDLVRLTNRVNVFNLVHEVLLRQSGLRPMLVVQSRAISAPVDADVVIGTDDGRVNIEQLSSLKRDLVNQLDQDGMRIRFVDGAPHIAGYELGNQLQVSTLNLARNKELVSLWLSPSLRTKYRQSTDNRLLMAQCETVGIPTVRADLFSYLSSRDDKPFFVNLPDDLRSSVEHFQRNYDIVALRQLTRRWDRFHFTRVIDHNSGQSFLLIADHRGDRGAVPHVVNLTGWLDDAKHTVVIDALTRERIQEFVDSRARWLEVRGAP